MISVGRGWIFERGNIGMSAFWGLLAPFWRPSGFLAVGYLEVLLEHLSSYAVGFLAIFGLTAFFSSRALNEPLIIIKVFFSDKDLWSFKEGAWGSRPFLVGLGILLGDLSLWHSRLLCSLFLIMAILGLSALSTASFLAMGYLENFGGIGLLSHLSIGSLHLLENLERALNLNQSLFSSKPFMAFWGLSAFLTAGFLATDYLEVFWGTCPSTQWAS